ncbi:type II toxin-antitoxin system RelE/ParE family toxin [Siminovitchia sp. 179-K 8D1 HS]|uniref:type II toxin-antitoxin system RelE/ParE family toxin n=1 Tax=Siminovitchia sp. 179-K 8D1 HS TaxID=3142385 RepID=UPI0039A1F96A
MIDIHFYADSRGRQPVLEWIQEIEKSDPVTFRKTFQLLTMLRENGRFILSGQSRRKDIKKLSGTDIWQLRINDNRVLFFYFSGNAIVLTNQFQKKQKSTPKTEIERAEARRKEWLEKQ